MIRRIRNRKFESQNEKEDRVIKDALDDLIVVLTKIDRCFDDLSEWFNAYGSYGMRGSNMSFKHNLENNEDVANAIYSEAERLMKKHYQYLPCAFRGELSIDEEPSNADAVEELYDEILDAVE
jgi:hypothetical protein